ncbi:hypothetical protein PhCBS80983_g05248 [Powellomyces hirtus]|uniref:Uncharacterized protein n=1 Tax=Powellomyces hirtus TaxID=109895 RepID=A0A507DVE9_9FUNG|nr:hypothetical protein PhCBS80983_g05248 [Powellomyces hirtus]
MAETQAVKALSASPVNTTATIDRGMTHPADGQGQYIPYEDEDEDDDQDPPPQPPPVKQGKDSPTPAIPRRQSFSDIDPKIGESRAEGSSGQAERPSSGLMLRKVPSFSAIRSSSPSTGVRSALPIRHNPLPAAHHNAGPYPLHHHPHHVTPSVLPTPSSAVPASVAPYQGGRSTLTTDASRRLAKFKSGESLKSLMGVMADGDRDRELVVETDAALQTVGRPPLFKSATLPCRSSKGKDEDFEEFVWSGSPDPHQTRNRRSFSTHLLPASTAPPSSVVPVSSSGSQRVDVAMSDYHTPPSAIRGQPDLMDVFRGRSQGPPTLKKSTNFRAPPRRSGQPSAPYLPLSSQYGGMYTGTSPGYLDEPSPERGSPTYLGGRGESSSGSIQEYARRPSVEEERAYLLRAKRRETRPRSAGDDSESVSDYAIPKPRSLIFLFGTILVLLLGTFVLFTFCIQPLSGLTILGIGDIHGTLNLYEFDVVFAAANQNIVPVYVRNVDIDVFVGSDLVFDQNVAPPEPKEQMPVVTTAGRSSPKELLAHIRHLTTSITFPALTPTTHTTPTGHIIIRDPENTLGKLIYLNYPYTLTVRGNIHYRTLWYVEYVVKVSCVVPVEHNRDVRKGAVIECVSGT